MNIEKTTVQTKHGDWQVHLKDNGDLQIVDSLGRQRHRSQGHMMTGVHLAMRLSESIMFSLAELDEALRTQVTKFEDNITPSAPEQPETR